ncbi:MAG: DUF134 domain-containing protein [Candidatus Cloacimonetes bacterium]|nr:DUF134 domain-containing protein [Candidatus Cloacimonadota bacterium]
MVLNPPNHRVFKPTGIPGHQLEVITLTIDEYEAIRLADYEGLDQLEASKRMGISRPTFTRLIEKARKNLASFIVESKALTIEGGNVHFKQDIAECTQCGTRIKVDFENRKTVCPECGSEAFISIAEQYGHGRCCRNRGGKSEQTPGCGRGRNK